MAEARGDEPPFAKGASAGLSARMRRGQWWLGGSAALFIAVFALAAFWAGGEKILVQLRTLGLPLLAGLCGLSLVNYAVRLLRWHLFSRQAGVRVPFGRNGLYFVAGFALTVTPGKLGEAVRLWLLRQGYGYRYERTAALLVADRLSDAAAMLILCLAGLSAFAQHVWSAAAVGGVILAVTVLFMRPGLLLRLVNGLYSVTGGRARLFAGVRTMLRKVAGLVSPGIFGATLLLALVGWMAEALALYWLLAQLGAEVGLLQAMFVFAFAMVAGAVAMLPGGLGGTEAGMVGLLAAIGVELDVAILATAVIRATTLWFAVALGLIALPLAMRRVRRQTGEG